MNTASAADPNMLLVENATVVFDGFKALDIDRFAVARNEVRVVIGPNGAGKTTLCDAISGKTRLTSGRICLNGSPISQLKDYEIARLGVGRKFQTPTVFGSLTVRETLGLAAQRSKSIFGSLFGPSDPEVQSDVMEVSEAVDLGDVLDTEAQFLSHGQRQSLEIGTLLVSRRDLLLIDEPAAGLSDQETAAMCRLLRKLGGRQTVIVIEHDMEFVRQLEADITVLNEGKILAEGPMSAVQSDPRVIEAYLGR